MAILIECQVLCPAISYHLLTFTLEFCSLKLAERFEQDFHGADERASVKSQISQSKSMFSLQAKQEVKLLTARLQNQELDAQPGMTMLETFESHVNQVLNKARDDAGTSAQNSLLPTNNVVRMVTAGSKGSFINISQVKPFPLQFLDKAIPIINSL